MACMQVQVQSLGRRCLLIQLVWLIPNHMALNIRLSLIEQVRGH